MIQTRAKIISNDQVTPQHFKLVLETPEIAKEAQPGQFVHVRVHDKLEPLLRRPFSIHRIRNQKPACPGLGSNEQAREYRNQIELLYKIRGKATEVLSGRKPGELLDVIGPLGNGFTLEPHTANRQPQTAVLVAGGIGVAPLIFLAEKLVSRKPIVLIGAKTKDLILCVDEFRKLGCEVKVATDDGSAGFKGLVTDLLRDIVTSNQKPVTRIYAAGPIFMLQEIKKIANIFKILSFGSLEENIACGLGGCLGCVVKTNQGYKRVCKEGPVFNLEEIIWG